MCINLPFVEVALFEQGSVLLFISLPCVLIRAISLSQSKSKWAVLNVSVSSPARRCC